MDVKLSQLQTDLGGFSNTLYRWSRQGRQEMLKGFRQVEHQFVAEAKKRIPVDEGRARSSIMGNTYEDALGDIISEVGTNVPEYPGYLEFGTNKIAGGRVKALGTDSEISDFEAIHNWPAKSRSATRKTSASMTTLGPLNAFFEQVGGPQEQMPWLRTAWTQIKNWAIGVIDNCMRPPEQRN